ncbi:proteasome assembly chaperone family protein [Halorarius litoreus]|uniref:proteasome assembly chaperone family protein n=1 Tax=Halorarius litoreus TaxID=2962676 RepID=UPI0020CB8154|nr:PAC2 family protein [Halorarius litoreus]
MSRADPSFAVSHDADASETLLCGFSEVGLAGLTAADYLVKQFDLEQTGHIDVEQLPTITPFENGTPRHHTRLFSRDDLEFTVLVGELLVPAYAADPFSEAILEWAETASVEEIVVASGVPTPHGPDDHRPFYIASRDYQAAHDLAAADVKPMSGGFLDGINSAITARGMSSPLQTCVFTTPAHPQTPDAEAALRLLGAIDRVYDLGLDTGPMETFASKISRYYEELADRMAAQETADRMPEDRMYM